jgi:uncharacterized protein (DUF2252 family)
VHNRPDPVNLLEEQNEDRLDWLIPVRRGRMSASPFAFFRGSARIMAADLSNTPVTGLTVQLCGDAHLGNFGLFASPERQLVFDISDFDETLAGPWEWDIKRLAASFTIAARHNGLKKGDTRKVTRRVVRAYRKAMADFSAMRTTDIWYAMLDSGKFIKMADESGRENQAKKITDKARTKDSRQALDKLAEEVDGQFCIISEPPNLIPLRELHRDQGRTGRDLTALANNEFEIYQKSVPDHCKLLLDRFHPTDVALKPLFLQLKEASPSVLEEYLSPSPYKNQGQRVVEGQHLMQTVSDIFLGWTKGTKTGKDYYWRQLRDWKGSADVENLSVKDLSYLARLCGWTLARAHARTGDPVAIAGYLGSSNTFDGALANFAKSYADQNERDYEEFLKQIRDGRLEAVSG